MPDEMSRLPDDPVAFANEVQRLAASGDFDPFAMLSGAAALHAVLIAPFTPAFAAARQRFLDSGDGPLAGTVQQLIAQGAPAASAAAQARDLFAQAHGMCVIILAGDHGLTTIPQLFFGHLAPAWRAQAVAACGAGFPHGAAVEEALARIETVAAHGRRFPHLVAGPAVGALPAFWTVLAGEVIATAEDSIVPGSRERLADLAWWCVEACAPLRIEPEPEAAAKLHLLAGDASRACAALARLEAGLLAGGGDEEAFVEALHHLVDAAIALGQPGPVAAWLRERQTGLDAALGGSYDLALARVKLAAAGASDDLAPAVAALIARNRKLARHDLTREPIWRVVAPPPGDELLEPGPAAELLQRPLPWLAKRLDQRTLPHHVGAAARPDAPPSIRLPRAALLAWKRAMDEAKLLD